MGTIKNKSIKPGGDFNYTEGVRVKAGEAITTGQLLYVSGHGGGVATVKKADATTSSVTGGGRLLIAKHDIPNGGYGVGLPWQVVTANTATMSLGAPIYLTTAGGFSNTTALNAKVRRQVGTVLSVAAEGRIMISPEAFSPQPTDYQSTGGVIRLVRLTEAGSATLDANGVVIDAWLVKHSTTGGGGSVVTLANGGATVEALSVAGVAAGEIVRANSLANQLVSAGNALTTVGSGGSNYESAVYVMLELF
tara:strand:- start:150 stop:899 length:750 start_codon:yes stop_codon:yes gene_type:complete